MTKKIRPTKHVEHARAFLIWCALATGVFCLAGCEKGPGGVESGSAPTPAQSPDLLSRPFRVGKKIYPTQTAFILEMMRDRCITTPPANEKRQAIEQRLQQRRSARRSARAPGTVEIPVYFHIITNADGTEGDVPDEFVHSQIAVLNAAYSGATSFGTGAASAFRFVLREIDRTRNDAWFNMSASLTPTAEETAAKAALNKGDESTLNLYTVKLETGGFGWARWPWDYADNVDGVVIRYSTLPGGDTYFYNEGDTAVHEIGHWLGLFHTFENACDGSGDSVDDTPPELGPSLGCPYGTDSCLDDSDPDSIDNFMNYTYDECMYRFTTGQAERMDQMHLDYRTP